LRGDFGREKKRAGQSKGGPHLPSIEKSSDAFSKEKGSAGVFLLAVSAAKR
jgi:hypothetical protein